MHKGAQARLGLGNYSTGNNNNKPGAWGGGTVGSWVIIIQEWGRVRGRSAVPYTELGQAAEPGMCQPMVCM